MGRTSTKNQVSQEQITVTSSGRKIIKPTSVLDPQPIGANNSNNKKNNKLKDSDSESESDSDISEEEQTQKSIINNKKKTTTVNRKEKETSAKTKKSNNITQNVENSDEEDDQDEITLPVQPKKRGRKPKQQSSSSSLATGDGSSITKKYTQRELDIITKQNRMVYIKFILFSIAMVVVPLMSFRLFNTTIGDYLGINRTDRVTYAGVASLLGLISVMASYSIMAYYED